MMDHIERLGADLKDCSMLVRRLAARHPGEDLSLKALDFLSRKGLGGEVLRHPERGNS